MQLLNCCPGRRLSVRLIVLVLLAMGAVPAWTQVAAAVSGNVKDASGADVGGATVTVTSLETGVTRTTATDEAGNFRIFSLPVGPQEIKVNKTGFKEAVRTGVNLEVGQQAVVNIQLQVGEVAQQVLVAAEAPVVNTTTDSVSGVVDERMVKDLPLNGRSFDNLVTLNPSAINYTSLKGVNTTTSEGNSFSIDGRRPQDNLFLINGIEWTGTSQLADTPGSVSGYMLGIDAVREFNLLTDTYGAEYGKRAGGASVGGDAIGIERIARLAIRISPQQRPGFARPGLCHCGRDPSFPPESIWWRAGRAAEEGPLVSVWKLRGISSIALHQQR